MTIKLFDFKKYDTDQSGWLSNREATVARKDNWCVWNGLTEDESGLIFQYSVQFKECQNWMSILNSKQYKEYKDKVTEILQRDGYSELSLDITYSDPAKQMLVENAKKEAKEELGLPPDVFEFTDEDYKSDETFNDIIAELKEINNQNTDKPSMGLDDIPKEPYIPPTIPSTDDSEGSEETVVAGSIEYHSKTENTKRAPSKTNGDFCSGWIEHDAYGSKSYEEWLKNNGYEYDSNTAISLAHEAYDTSRSGKHRKHCGRAYRIAAQRAKLWGDSLYNDYGYQFASELAKNPNFKELPHNIVENMDLAELPKGCVIVYDAGYKNDNKNHSFGHIAVTTGNGNEYGGGWCDKNNKHHATMKICQAKKQDHIRVFIPIIKE